MSGHPILCYFVMAEHQLLLHFNIQVWFEFVPSDDNWADGISRNGFKDPIVESLLCNESKVDWSPMYWPQTAKELLSMVRDLYQSD